MTFEAYLAKPAELDWILCVERTRSKDAAPRTSAFGYSGALKAEIAASLSL